MCCTHCTVMNVLYDTYCYKLTVSDALYRTSYITFNLAVSVCCTASIWRDLCSPYTDSTVPIPIPTPNH